MARYYTEASPNTSGIDYGRISGLMNAASRLRDRKARTRAMSFLRQARTSISKANAMECIEFAEHILNVAR